MEPLHSGSKRYEIERCVQFSFGACLSCLFSSHQLLCVNSHPLTIERVCALLLSFCSCQLSLIQRLSARRQTRDQASTAPSQIAEFLAEFSEKKQGASAVAVTFCFARVLACREYEDCHCATLRFILCVIFIVQSGGAKLWPTSILAGG